MENLRTPEHRYHQFFGRLGHSTAAVAELSSRVRETGEGFVNLAYRGVVLATGAMLLRNSLILAILAVQAFTYSLVPMLIMLATTAILLRFGARTAIGTMNEPPPDLKLEQPFSLKAALKFGVLTRVLARTLLIVVAAGIFGVVVHKPLERAFRLVRAIDNTPTGKTH